MKINIAFQKATKSAAKMDESRSFEVPAHELDKKRGSVYRRERDRK